jgi:hypothetical protein
MNDVLIEFKLGPAALEYMRECLAHGKTLGQYLLKREDLANGGISTYLPVDLPAEAVQDFRTGGKLKRDPKGFRYWREGERTFRAEPVPNTDPWLASVVQEYLRSEPDRVCVFENSSAAPGHPWLLSSGMGTVIFESEVYHFLCSRDLVNEEKILTTIGRTKSWLFYGTMTALSGASNLPLETGTIAREALEMFAQRAEKIVVGAYDGEGYLIWSKPAS